MDANLIVNSDDTFCSADTARSSAISKPVGDDDLGALPRAALLELWRDLHERPPPKNLSVTILRNAIAFELQAKQNGGYRKRMRKELQGMARGKAVTPRPEARLQVGTRLVREWRGRTWTLEVVEDGFLMNGKTFDSLSAIAKLITGAHWSGPRFFGLNKPCAEASNA